MESNNQFENANAATNVASKSSQPFTCIGNSHSAPCVQATKEEWEQKRREAWLKELCQRIENGDEEAKHRLPVWTPHCAEFRNNHRAIADALKPLNRLMLDFDEKGKTDEIMNSFVYESVDGDSEKTRLMAGRLKVHFVEESVRRGTHVLVELPDGMTADEVQQLMKEVTGYEPDKAVKDVSRCIYMVPEDHTRYVSEEMGRPSPQPLPGMEGSGQKSPTALSTPSPIGEGRGRGLSFRGIPYTSIIREWWLRNGGEPQLGERNVKLHRLAVNLRAICDNKKEVLQAVMPRLGLSEEEVRSIVDSACKEQPKGISKLMQEIIDDLEAARVVDEAESAEPVADMKTLKVNVRALPVGLKESLVGVPENMQLPVLCSVLPIAGAYADQMEVEYCDGNRHHLGLMSMIIGDQASGKSVCKNAVDVWKRPFEAEDAVARQDEDKWKERKKSRKANEKAPEDPKVLIRMVPVTVSCSTLLKRMKNAQGHCLYSFGEELDTLRKTNGAGSWSSKYDIYRLSFDQGEWGQDYNSDQAESGVVKVAYNWSILGTKGSFHKCFKRDNVENGLSSRVLVAMMPDCSFAKMPKYKHRTPEEEARIVEATTILRSTVGFVDTPRLRKRMEDWVERKRVEAAKDIDHVKDTFRRRAAVIGFRSGAIFHALTGRKKESKACLDFAELIAEYALLQQIAAFGEALSNEYANAANEGMRCGANKSIFDQLPPVFTVDEVSSLKGGKLKRNSLNQIVLRWKKLGLVEKLDDTHWRKIQ